MSFGMLSDRSRKVGKLFASKLICKVSPTIDLVANQSCLYFGYQDWLISQSRTFNLQLWLVCYVIDLSV